MSAGIHLAFLPGDLGPGPQRRPYPDQVLFIFGPGPEDLKHQLANCCRGVHAFRERCNLDALRSQVIDESQQVLEDKDKGIEPPQHQHVIPAHLLTKTLQFWSVRITKGT